MILEKKYFTLVELLVVIIVIAFLVMIAVPNFAKSKQRVLNKEAVSQLKLLHDAQRVNYLARQDYRACADNAACWNVFKVDLSSSVWQYTVETDGATTFWVNATNSLDSRVWSMNQNMNNPVCNDHGHHLDFCFDG